MKKDDVRHYVAVLPDGTEKFFDAHFDHQDSDWAARQAVDGLTTPRADPQPVRVKVMKLKIRNGKLEREFACEHRLMPRLAPMTEAEYIRHLEEAVKSLPDEFRTWVRGTAWEQGHSAGYEEVVSIAESMADELKPVVDVYTRRILTQF